MKKLLNIIILIIFPATFTTGQQNPYWDPPTADQADSLKTLLDQNIEKKLQMYCCNLLGKYYQEVQTDSALYYYKIQLSLSQELGSLLWEADALSQIGYVFSLMGNYPSSLEALLKAKKMMGEKETKKDVLFISHFFKDQSIEKATLTVKANILEHIGILYEFTGDYEQALSNYFECRDIAFAIDDKALLSLIHMNIGGVYLLTNELDSAINSEKIALDYAEESKYEIYNGYIFYVIGQIYMAKRDFDLSKKYFEESVSESLEQEALSIAGLGYLGLAHLFKETGELDSSLYYARKGISRHQFASQENELVKMYSLLSSIYKKQNKMDSAFYYQDLSIKANDILQGVERTRRLESIGFDEQIRTRELENEKLRIRNNIRVYSSLAGLGVFLFISFILFHNNKNKKKANNALRESLANLKATQSQLIQSEKMASLGELTAGIAHEIQNPLNFVNNFSEVSKELAEELKVEAQKPKLDGSLISELAEDIVSNQEKIHHHGQRASGIVKGMLEHSRTGDGVKEPTDLNVLADEYLRLAYHGLRAKDKSFNADFKTDLDPSLPKVNVVPQDIGRVLLNLINNAFYACAESSRSAGSDYQPMVEVSTKTAKDKIEISIQDNGPGIPEEIKDKIFQPFFTTKPTGSGTGLGLSLSYDIITQGHDGHLEVESDVEIGTRFIIEIPITN